MRGIKSVGMEYLYPKSEHLWLAAVWFEAQDGTVLGFATADYGDRDPLAVGTAEDLVDLGTCIPSGNEIEWSPWPLGACNIDVVMSLCVETKPDRTGAVIWASGAKAAVNLGVPLKYNEDAHYVGEGVLFTSRVGERLLVRSVSFLHVDCVRDREEIDHWAEFSKFRRVENDHEGGLAAPSDGTV
jgi:hypothetical protein